MTTRSWILKPPTWQETADLLASWRLWLIGAALGALLGAAAYLLSPPVYRAQATILVDQNVEQVIPEEQSDLRKYTYLQRETDKLIEIAWSDAVLGRVSEESGLPVDSLRDGRLILSQPSDGGWHFLAEDTNPDLAVSLASAWARSFYEELQSQPPGVSRLLEVNPVQIQDLPVQRSVSPGIFIFGGSLIGAGLAAFLVLFVHPLHKGR